MRFFNYIIILVFLNSCSGTKDIAWNCVQIDPGNMAFVEMQQLIGNTKIDTNKINSVKIYSFDFKKNGKIRDSTLIEHQDLFPVIESHSKFEIKQDSLGRDFERYVIPSKNGKSYLNYRKLYNSKSQLVEWIIFTNDGKIYSKTFYYYDSAAYMIKSERYYGYFLYDKPVLDRRSIFEYDGQNLVKETEFSSLVSSGEFDAKLIKEYNTRGQTINYRSETLKNEQVVSFWGYKSFYDGEYLIEEQRYGSDNRNSTTVYKYDASNLPIATYSFDLNKNKPVSLIKYFYLKNKKGNDTHLGQIEL